MTLEDLKKEEAQEAKGEGHLTTRSTGGNLLTTNFDELE